MVDRLEVSRICQITEAHCGPAVMQMLLAHQGVAVTQDEVTETGGARDVIDEQGMRTDQLALAVRRLAPHLQFWYKEHARVQDLMAVVIDQRLPVGVEWQGIFDGNSEDCGHYSVVTYIDEKEQKIWIADPYQDYFTQDRVLPLRTFVRRWWDTNEVLHPRTGRPQLVEDYHMMFFVTSADATFPQALGMKTYRDRGD